MRKRLRKKFKAYKKNLLYLFQLEVIDHTPAIFKAYEDFMDLELKGWKGKTEFALRKNDFSHTLTLTQQLLSDKEELLHKACGWMLREVGKRNQQILEIFLKKHCNLMPRVMLRYAIEKFTQQKRLSYLKVKR